MSIRRGSVLGRRGLVGRDLLLASPSAASLHLSLSPRPSPLLSSLSSSSSSSLMSSSFCTTSFAQQQTQMRYSSSSSSGGGSGDKGPTMFEQLDAWFGSPDASSPVAEAVTSSSYGSDWLYSLAQSSGLEGGVVLLLAGAATRLATLYFSLYGDRAAARMQCAMVELKPAYDGFHRMYHSERSKATDIQNEATRVQAFKREVYAKYQTSNVKSFASLLASPLIIYGFRTASQLSNPIHLTGFGTQSFAWLTLGLPDPSFVLPAASAGLTLLNFELALSAREDTSRKGWARNIVLCARGGALCALPVLSMVNSGVLLFWIGMSTVGLLQPLLMRSEAFRKAFKVPELPQTKEEDPLKERLGIEHPFIHRLLNTESDATIDLITKATFKQQGQVGMPSSGSTPAFSSGLSRSGHVPTLGHSRPLRRSRSLEEDMAEAPITSFKDMAGDFAVDSGEAAAAASAAAKAGGATTPEARSSGASFASAGWKHTNIKK